MANHCLNIAVKLCFQNYRACSEMFGGFFPKKDVSLCKLLLKHRKFVCRLVIATQLKISSPLLLTTVKTPTGTQLDNCVNMIEMP